MTDDERIAAYIACCKTCLLAEAMKDCPLCKFQIELAEKQPVKLEEANEAVRREAQV